MKYWLTLLGLLFPCIALSTESIPFGHWTVMSRSDPDTRQTLIAAYTRNADGHLIAFGQHDNGPIEGTLILDRQSGSGAHAGHGLRLHIPDQGEHRIGDLRIPEGARQGNSLGIAHRVEWGVWEKRRGGTPPDLIRAMGEGSRMEVEFTDAQGQPRKTRFSLNGADRALAWILQEGPMTASYHTVDSLSEDAALQCRRRANGDTQRRDACFDHIVACWDKQGKGSVAAFRGCLSNADIL